MYEKYHYLNTVLRREYNTDYNKSYSVNTNTSSYSLSTFKGRSHIALSLLEESASIKIIP